MVEPASAFFKSSLAHPMMAPQISEIQPTMSTSVRAMGAASKIALERTMRYTPAVTMVAAWMRADTGVGPSIASKSHACSGNCALLPQAASNSSRPIQVVVLVGAEPTPALTVSKVTPPNTANMAMMATDRPKSPTRLMMKAFLAATAATSLYWYQPMSRNDARPTPSHPTYSSR
ncbi:unannotated protein [freshwater metagenome]|uniref:Unannotated protein n=1 Tax=freshwater metagenome TaxID=449393 RepID=A0A6J7PAY0_9ZZZZ